jgi:hypothetical protein
MERQLMKLDGIALAFQKHGKKLFQTTIRTSGAKMFDKNSEKDSTLGCNRQSQIAW